MKKAIFALTFFTLLGYQFGGSEQIVNTTETTVIKTQQIRAYSDEEIAFAGAAFGMSMNEVLSLEYFKNWEVPKNVFFDYKSIRNIIKIGNEGYRGEVRFYNDELYLVSFETYSPVPAEYYELVIDDLKNFKEVIEAAYGKPTHSYGIPSISKVGNTSATAYVWEIGKKKITLSVFGDFIDYPYRFYASIENVSMTNKIKQDARESAEKDKKEASSLF